MIQRSMALKSSRTGMLEKLTAFLDSRALEKSVNQYKKEEQPGSEEENEAQIQPEDESTGIDEEVLKFDTKEIDTEAVRKGLGE